ncbi:MAG TPA: SDR family NAD(P)-dependent oxidoreductase, partial [Daejeonella sp.]|nr:SDR family NAD(P)-dependent oxidoreductase [Daejeonella sp.]
MSKLALITGATAGIGEACSRLFAENGYNLILLARRTDKLNALAEQLRKDFGIQVITVTADVRNKTEVLELDSLSDDWKEVDVLVNNAGLSQGLDPIHQGHTDDWDTMIDTNVKGLLYITRTVSPWMVSRKSGHIVNIG